MEYKMQFCVGCYLEHAMSLAQSIMENNPHAKEFSLTLFPGESGSFDITKDNQLIYSKKASGRLPTTKDLNLSEPSDSSIEVQEKEPEAPSCSC
jgi:selT/selW/selH-like putative selenoprotein